MYYYLNNLSMNQGAVQINAEAVILQFLKICRKILDYRFEKLVVHEGFLDTLLVDGITIRSYWNSNNNTDIGKRLRSLRANTMAYNFEEPLTEDIKKLEDVTLNDISST